MDETNPGMRSHAASFVAPGTAATIDDFRNLADMIPQLAWIAGEDGGIFWYNKRWTDYTGMSAGDMNGRDWVKVHHPDHVDRVVEHYDRSFKDGEPWEDTFPLRGVNGGYRWFLSRAMPLRDEQGRAYRWFGTNTDVTDQLAVEDQLSRSEERFRRLVDASADTVWVATPEGELVPPLPSWTAFTGQTDEEYRGLGWIDAIHPADRALAAATWQASVTDRSAYRMDYRLRRADGTWRFVEARGVPVLNAQGGLREWVGTTTDITERKEAEQKIEAARKMAEAANRAKSQFIANMSHELRTPLSAVIGYSEMVKEELADMGESALTADVNKIESSARHLLGLINDVLDLSKIEAGRMTMSIVEFQVDTMLKEVADSIGSLIQKNNNSLKLDVAPDLGQMRSDDLKIRQCLLNLLGNAAKFTENGVITLSARAEARDGVPWVVFQVSDSGIGMTQEQVSRLFERFSQADESTTRQFGGTGLGLALTRAFSRKLGGDVAVTSVEGSGSTFEIAMPAELPPDQPAADDVMRDVDHHGGDRDLVLVVDDDPAARDLLSRFLVREGFAVRTAADGEAGLALARELMPRAILLDVEMPRMDGWSVLHAIRSDPDVGATPVIMISVVNEQSLGYALGATDYLTKPIEWDRLKRVMERYSPVGTPGEILIIDDDADARSRLRIMLTRDGWSIIEAANGKEALHRIQQHLPNLIMLDLMMPVMDGFSFLHELRGMDGGKTIPVIVLTAKDVTPDERAYLQHETDRVILKGSFKLSELAQALRKLAPSDSKSGNAD